MIKHVWSLACWRAVVDSRTNNIYIQQVIEHIQLRIEPHPDFSIPLEMEIISYWVRGPENEPEKGEVRISFRRPSGSERVVHQDILDLESNERLRTLLTFEKIGLPELGRYTFVVDQRVSEDEWMNVAEIPLFVSYDPDGETHPSEPTEN